jgi:hypothetical protein
MSVLDGALSTDSAAEKIFSILGNDDGPAAEVPMEQLSDEAKASRIAQEPEPGEETPEAKVETNEPAVEAEPQTPPIEPPAFWDAEAKERFKALGPDLQRTIAEKERERESVFGKTQREAAEARKAAEAERQAIQSERQQLATRLTSQIDYLESMDPVLAEGRKTDWAKASQTDPIATQQKWFEWQQREMQVAQLSRERDAARQRIEQDSVRKAEEVLATKLDFWGDSDKRKSFQTELRTHLQGEGYSTDEISGINDPRAVLTARKAMLYDQLMAQQATIASKLKQAPAPKTVLKTQAPSDDKSDKTAAALKRAKSFTRTEDQAALIASLVD